MALKAVALIVLAAGLATALRRTPKVYNALISTDENLLSSRAFPLIQPTIQESGIATYPYGSYKAYGYYPQVVRFGHPIAPGLNRNQVPYFPPNAPKFRPRVQAPLDPTLAQKLPSVATTTSEANVEQHPTDSKAPQTAEDNASPSGMSPDQAAPATAPQEKLPIALNADGLPPALIPLQAPYRPNPYGPNPYAPNHHTPNPYAFTGLNPYYPLIYNPVPPYREHYLPPHDFTTLHQPIGAPYYPVGFPGAPGLPSAARMPAVPGVAGAAASPSVARGAAETATTNNLAESSSPIESAAAHPSIISGLMSGGDVNLESINNVSKKNDVPDVPPPPPPTSKQQQEQPGEEEN